MQPGDLTKSKSSELRNKAKTAPLPESKVGLTVGVRTAIVCPFLKRQPLGANNARTPERQMAEAIDLARAINLEITETVFAPLSKQRPATLLGSGKVSAIATDVRNGEIELVVVDAQLTPVQQRNLERAWQAKVLDRTGLILEIFGERAQTQEGRLQVEHAHLTYQKSRLVRSWTHLERQRGGHGFLGGPGETQIEADRRAIQERIDKIAQGLQKVKRTRALQRRSRTQVPYPVVALVGYTNAGKSTLFNRLTGAEVFSKDLLFATLDPTLRKIDLPGGANAILADTVGFIHDLPTDLVAAFRATLEEVVEADIILHVRDISHPQTIAQKEDVEKVLASLGIDTEEESRIIEVANKIDLLTTEQRTAITNVISRSDNLIAVSAQTGEGEGDLRALIEKRLEASSTRLDVTLPAHDGARIAWLYEHCHILKRDDKADGTIQFQITSAPAIHGQIENWRNDSQAKVTVTSSTQ